METRIKFTSLILSLIIVFAVSCTGNSAKNEKSVDSAPASFIEVSITGMTCAGCENTVQTSVLKIDGVKTIKASAVTGKAIIEYSARDVDTSMIRKAIVASGYGVTGFNQTVPADSTIK